MLSASANVPLSLIMGTYINSLYFLSPEKNMDILALSDRPEQEKVIEKINVKKIRYVIICS